jgi:hypothetical protein
MTVQSERTLACVAALRTRGTLSGSGDFSSRFVSNTPAGGPLPAAGVGAGFAAIPDGVRVRWVLTHPAHQKCAAFSAMTVSAPVLMRARCMAVAGS